MTKPVIRPLRRVFRLAIPIHLLVSLGSSSHRNARLAGGSTYGGPPDLVGDIIEPGAFKQSIQQQGKGYPLLWAHLQSEPIGLARVSDSKDGLVVDGTLLLSDPAGERAHDHLKMGSIKGLSIGYSVLYGAGKVAYSDAGCRVAFKSWIARVRVGL